MECHKCEINQKIQEVVQKFPKGDAPEELIAGLRNACLACSHGCSSCKTTYSVTTKDGKKERRDERTLDLRARYESAIAIASHETPETLAQLQEIVASADSLDCRFSEEQVIEAKKRLYDHEHIDDYRKRIVRMNKRCSSCKRSADDNPSNHGQIFVSLDSGEAYDGKESVDSRSDWMLSNMSPDYAAQLPNEKTARDEEFSTLFPRDLTPADIEEKLKHEFMNLLSLDEMDKMLCVMLMSKKKDKMAQYKVRFNSIVDFARMEWIPECMQFENGNGPFLRAALEDLVKHIRSQNMIPPSDPATANDSGRKMSELERLVVAAEDALYGERAKRKGITKQAAHARFMRIIKKMPTLMAVAHDTIGKGSGGSGKVIDTDTEQMEFGFF